MQAFPDLYEAIIQLMQGINPVAYTKTRNFTNGAVTYLSPYISRGVITLQQVKETVLSNGYTLQQSEKLLQELAWREYFQRVWQAKGKGIEADIRQPQPRVLHQQMPAAIVNASTGIDAVDAGIQHLYATGYMHNHLRMYTASLACNCGGAHWKLPARWMYYHLLDGDIASNYCSWQWVAGAFSSKKYYCNQQNINTYTGTRQSNTFLDISYEALPALPVPQPLQTTAIPNLKTVLPQTAFPVIDDSIPTLIYHSYNLDPLWRKDEQVNRILLLEPAHFEQYPVSEKVLAFILALSKNIPGLQVYCGGFDQLYELYKEKQQARFIFKEHPACTHYRGVQDERSWMYPEVRGYFPSFSAYWKKCERYSRPGPV